MRVDSGSMLYTGLEGIRNGQQQASEAGSRIARAGSDGQGFDAGNFARDAVELKSGENQVKASASVVKAADRALGALVDTFA